MTSPGPLPAARPSHMLRWSIVLGITILAASLIGARLFLGSGSKPATQSEASPQLRVIAFGYVDVQQSIRKLAPPFAGRVVSAIVESDDEVDVGTVLVEFDSENAQKQLVAADADLAAAKLAVEGAKQQAKEFDSQKAQQAEAAKVENSKVAAAKIRIEHMEVLLKKDGVPESEVKAVKEELKALEAQAAAADLKLKALKDMDSQILVKRAEEDVTAKQAQRDRADKFLQEHKLKAPMKGRVLRVLVSAGDMYSPEMRMPAVFFCPSGERIIRAEIDQEFASRVHQGQVVCIQDDANNQGRWTGKVSRVGDWFAFRRDILPEPIQLHDVRTLECIIDHIKPAAGTDPDERPLRINQRMRVTIYPDGDEKSACKDE